MVSMRHGSLGTALVKACVAVAWCVVLAQCVAGVSLRGVSSSRSVPAGWSIGRVLLRCVGCLGYTVLSLQHVLSVRTMSSLWHVPLVCTMSLS